MSVLENLTAFLAKEGYKPEATEFGLQVKVQGLDFVHFKDDNDTLFFNIFFPQIMPVTEENKADILVAIDAANNTVKLAKGAVRFGNAVWVGCEMLLNEGYDLSTIVPRCLDTMVHYRGEFYKAYSQTPTGKAEMEAAQAAQAAQQPQA